MFVIFLKFYLYYRYDYNYLSIALSIVVVIPKIRMLNKDNFLNIFFVLDL